jgi:hypothetical protein
MIVPANIRLARSDNSIYGEGLNNKIRVIQRRAYGLRHRGVHEAENPYLRVYRDIKCPAWLREDPKFFLVL